MSERTSNQTTLSDGLKDRIRKERAEMMADVSTAMRIIDRAKSWINIQLAANPSAKGQSIYADMCAWLNGQSPIETKSRLYPHWHCDTHGDFDAHISVGCPECMREARQMLKAIETFGKPFDQARGSHLDGTTLQVFFRSREDAMAAQASIFEGAPIRNAEKEREKP